MENTVNTATNSDQPQPISSLDGEQLEDALLKQIEYYFSRQNLANDAFLVSQMDTDMWVPIGIIAGFKKVGMLTTDADFIARVLTKSTNVIVDQQKKMIKPSWKLQRNTIILRDMPADASVEEVRALFSDKFLITDTHSDIGNSWFISFDTEDTALDAMMWVRNQQFRGTEVKARMKSEHLLKTATPYVAGTLPEGYGYIPPRGAYMSAPVYPHIPQGQYWSAQQSDRPYRGRRPQNPATQPSYKDGRKGQVQVGIQPVQSVTFSQGSPLAAVPVTSPRVLDDRKGGKSRKPKKIADNKPLSFASVPQMNTQHFPPLGRQRAGSFKTGYAKEFKKFSRDDIMRVIQTVTDIASNEILPAAKECGVLASTPNKALEIVNAPAITPSAVPQEVVEPVKEWPQREWPEKQSPKIDVPSPSTEVLAAEKVVPLSPITTKTMPKVPSYADITLGVSRTNSPPIIQAPGSPQTSNAQSNNIDAKLI